jgi:hypothetical protein
MGFYEGAIVICAVLAAGVFIWAWVVDLRERARTAPRPAIRAEHRWQVWLLSAAARPRWGVVLPDGSSCPVWRWQIRLWPLCLIWYGRG